MPERQHRSTRRADHFDRSSEVGCKLDCAFHGGSHSVSRFSGKSKRQRGIDHRKDKGG